MTKTIEQLNPSIEVLMTIKEIILDNNMSLESKIKIRGLIE